MAERDFRKKIQWFTFVFSLLVIWVHSSNAELFLGDSEAGLWERRVQEWVGEGLGQIAVPGFFMISAYLFFRNFKMKDLASKWESRVQSVLVPYIVWNAIYYLGYVAASRLPFVTDVVGKGVVPFHLAAAVDAILNYTYNYVFWYLRQLILLILLAPVLYLALRRRALAWAYLLSLTAALYAGLSAPYLNLDALWYYSIGACAAIRLKGMAEGSWNGRRAAAGALLIAAALWMKYRLAVSPHVMYILGYRLSVPLGLWFLVPERSLPEVRPWMCCNFFLYASHFALVRLINKTGAIILPPVPVIPIALFVAMPVLVLLAAYPAACLLRSRLPLAWGLLNGGRGGGRL